MEYTVNQLAKLSGVSTRTLRYYDQIGLLKPARVNSNGYRQYGQREVDLLQQILFYRALDVALAQIKALLRAPDFDREQALQSHLLALLQRKAQIDELIQNVNQSIALLKGETTMNDEQKFAGFRTKLIEENEKTYGQEARAAYGDQTVDAANAKLQNMSEQDYARAQSLREQLERTLQAALQTADPAGALAQQTCALHKQWISLFWQDGMYSKEAHKALGQMYVADDRFKAYYDNLGQGAAQFFLDALEIYCGS